MSALNRFTLLEDESAAPKTPAASKPKASKAQKPKGCL